MSAIDSSRKQLLVANTTTNKINRILFKQINLAKSHAAQANLAKCLVEWSCLPLFVFLQEPATSKRGKILSLPRGTQVFSADEPRTAILATPDLKVWPMSDFMSKDVATCLWKTDDALVPEIILLSVYADINKETISKELQEITNYCGTRHLPIIICCDTNAHSVIWGCNENNARGDDFETFIAGNNLSILNIGGKPTFETSRASSIIDISLVSYNLYDMMSDWNVKEEDFVSDHKCIEFQLNMSQPPQASVKNWRRTVWLQFESCVLSKGATWSPPTRWNRANLDAEVEQLNTEILSALENSTPSFVPRHRLRKNKWWTEDVTEARKVLRISYRVWKVTGSDEDRQKYLDARHYMKRSVKNAKVESWQTFCSEAGTGEEGSSQELSRLNKILQSNSNRTMGLLRCRNGKMASSPEESINILLDEHFPDSIQADDLISEDTYSDSEKWDTYPWLSAEKIRRAISMFSPYKTAGLDEFKPIVLQNLPPRTIERLGVLFKASMELSYVPALWRKSKAIFIPKTGKEDYAHVRSWRPISLMSFIFKTLERLILWHLEETVLKEFTMHKDQHAFRKGRSTESALSDTVDYLESAVLRQGVAVGVFLDIEGAFDNLLPEGVIRSLRTRNTPEKILMWFQKYLSARDVIVDYKGVKIKRRLVKGTPQGGVLSPILWNLAFDEVLTLLEGSPIKASGYADDLALIGRGPDPLTTINNMQIAMDKVAAWGLEQGLRFSASKSIAIAFTRKRKWKGPKLRLNNIELEWQDQVKYLGVILDQTLKWAANFRDRTTKATRLLFKYKQIVGKEFGPQPKYMRWMYTSIIRPALSYGAVVWWRIASDKTRMEKLTKISRLALLTFGPVRKSTPTVGMEVMGYLTPLDLYLEGEVVKAWLRIKDLRQEIWDGIGTGRSPGHRRALRKLTESFSLPNHEWDEMPETKKWCRLFKVNTDFRYGLPTYSTVKCFTDGSKSDGKAGAAYCITINENIVKQEALPLGTHPTVYQAELTAILHAAEALRPFAQLGQITIFSDSQAALLALDNVVIKSKLVLTTNMELDRLSLDSKYPVKLGWVKAHAGHTGNEAADALAKESTKMTPPGPGPVVPVAKSQINNEINEEIEKRWNKRWLQTKTARQSKLMWPIVDKNKSKKLLLCNRQEYSELVRMLTGHNNLNRHSFLLGESESADCRFCLESEETAEHLLCDCPAISGTRHRILGTHQTDAATLSLMPLDGVRRFIQLLRQKLSEEGLEQI
jgi:ribonuclease HI